MYMSNIIFKLINIFTGSLFNKILFPVSNKKKQFLELIFFFKFSNSLGLILLSNSNSILFFLQSLDIDDKFL